MKRAAATINRTDLMFRAFSDRTRLRMLYLLQDGECCVGDLVHILRIEQPTASRHLAYLRRAGLVSARKSRNWIYYSLARTTTPFHKKLLECLACCFNEVPQIREDAVQAAQVRETGGCCPGGEKRREKSPRKTKKGGKGEACCSS